MILKKYRLNQKRIDLVFKDGKYINSTNITFKFLLNKESPINKISFIVPKGTKLNAIERNRLRRRGYSIISKHLTILPKGITGAFIFSKKSKEIFPLKGINKKDSILKLEKEILFILNKLKSF